MNSQDHKENIICNWCGQPGWIIWVHGHGQCSVCGINVDECCRGEQCEIHLKEETPDKNTTKKIKDDK